MDDPRLPTFLVIGAAKAGTTSLSQYLGQHPDVFLTPKKGTRFFSLEGADLTGFRWTGAKPLDNLSSIVRLEDYRQQFAGRTQETAAGELCPFYLYYPGTAERIRRYVPNIKLIAVLRNPVDRAYSHYQHLRQQGREPLAFADAVAAEAERISQRWWPDYYYVALGFYFRQLAPFYEHFPAAQIRVLLYDDLKRSPSQLMAEIFDFAGVDRSVELDLSRHFNVTRLPRSRLAGALFIYRHLWTQWLGWLPAGWKRRMRTTYTDRLTVAPDPLSPPMRAQLADRYREDILALQDLIGQDLSAWLRRK